MLTVISPAKTLDYDTPPVTERFTLPQYLDDSQALIVQLRELSPAQISELMHLSDKLAGLNAARFGSWTPDFTPANAKQALLAFKGDVYTGLDAQSLGEDDFSYAQDHLRMLSGLYGLLRPLDLMQPYRLEMGTKLANARGKDLYAFWGTRISEWLNQALADQGDDVLLNLASNEYFSAVKLRYLKNRVPSAIRRATVIATPSNYVRESIEQHFGVERARTAVVRHGLEPAIGAYKTPEHELRARLNLGNSRVLLIPAITHPHKNHEFLLRLLANEWRNEDVKLVMVGGNGLAESQIQSLISELGVANKVVRSGRVQAADRDGLIALAEALVFPSKYEGFGAPVLEAMALGTPVISSDCASLPEVIGDGGLVLPLNSEAWAGALDVIRAQRSTLVQNGLRRAEEFTSAKSAQDLVIAYEKALAVVSR